MNISHVQNRVYRTIGQVMSTVIVQGGDPPALLSPLVVNYLLTGDIFLLTVTPDDVADMELREALSTLWIFTLLGPALPWLPLDQPQWSAVHHGDTKLKLLCFNICDNICVKCSSFPCLHSMAKLL